MSSGDPPPSPWEHESSAGPVKVGDDGRTRLEKDLGLDIDPATGRAYESQGDFANLGLGTSGRFRNGVAVPRVACCAACERIEAEAWYGAGWTNWGALLIGGQWWICRECVLRVLHSLPMLRAKVAATNGGNLRSSG